MLKSGITCFAQCLPVSPCGSDFYVATVSDSKSIRFLHDTCVRRQRNTTSTVHYMRPIYEISDRLLGALLYFLKLVTKPADRSWRSLPNKAGRYSHFAVSKPAKGKGGLKLFMTRSHGYLRLSMYINLEPVYMSLIN